jgi:hypothetical protein
MFLDKTSTREPAQEALFHGHKASHAFCNLAF